MNALRQARERKGLSQTKTAAKLGIAQGMLSDFESGKRIPWPKLRRRISRTLGLPPEKLFDDRGRVIEANDGGGDDG